MFQYDNVTTQSEHDGHTFRPPFGVNNMTTEEGSH